MNEKADINSDKPPLEMAVEYFGSGKKLAYALGVNGQAVTNWRRRGQVPVLRALQIEKLTRGKIKAALFSSQRR